MCDNELSDVAVSFLSAVRETCVCLNYGEFDGMKAPSLAEMYKLRGLLEGLIEETRCSQGTDR